MGVRAVYRAVLLAGALTVAALVASQLMTLLLVVTVTLIVSLPLSAAASRAERLGLPRALGALAALLAAIVLLSAIAAFLIPQFVDQAREFASRLPTILANAQRYLHPGVRAHTGSLASELTRFVQSYTHHPQRLIGPLEQIGLTAATAIAGVVLVLLGAFLIAVNPTPLLEGFLRLVPVHRRGQAINILARVRTAWLGWFTAVGLDMLVLGGLLFLGLALIGLPFALGFAVFSAVLTVIPNYGSIISAIPPIVVGLAQSPREALLVLTVYVLVNQIEGNLILPLIMARTVDMHPAVVTIGLLAMAALFGLLGVFISIPLLSLAIILVEALWIEPQEAAASIT